MSVLSSVGGGAPSNSGVTIQGQIPFGNGGSAFGQAIGGPLGSAYMSAYNAALAQNQAQYQNILSGYQQVANNQNAAQNQVQAGYGNLNSQVQGTLGNALQWQLGGAQNIQTGYNNLNTQVQNQIANIGQSQSEQIANEYQQQSGQLAQQMINSGLGNTTVQGSMQGGLLTGETQAQTALANQLAQLQAGYTSQIGGSALNYLQQENAQNVGQMNLMAQNQSQLGQAGLQYANQAAMQNTAQANNQLGFMNSVQMQYPNAQEYGQLSQSQAALAAQQQFQAKYGNSLYGTKVNPQGYSGTVGPMGGTAFGPSQMSNGSVGGYGMQLPSGSNQLLSNPALAAQYAAQATQLANYQTNAFNAAADNGLSANYAGMSSGNYSGYGSSDYALGGGDAYA